MHALPHTPRTFQLHLSDEVARATGRPELLFAVLPARGGGAEASGGGGDAADDLAALMQSSLQLAQVRCIPKVSDCKRRIVACPAASMQVSGPCTATLRRRDPCHDTRVQRASGMPPCREYSE
mgnify:CR=1 FL=1